MSEKAKSVYWVLREFLEDTNQKNFATRMDCVAFCMGYYGQLDKDAYDAVQKLFEDNWVKA